MASAVSVVIPAYNEAKRVGAVVEAALSAGFDEVTVVDDGSSDGTGDVAEKLGAKVLRLSPNRRKGGALKAGIEASKGDVILMLDADMVGFDKKSLHLLADPVVNGAYHQVVGVTKEASRATAGKNGDADSWRGTVILSGQRAVRREFLERLPAEAWNGYGIEVWLNDVVQRFGGKTAVFRFDDVQAVMKWEKDPAGGAAKMADMLAEVFYAMQRVIAYYQEQSTMPSPSPDNAASTAPAAPAQTYHDAPVAQTLQAKCSSTECVADAVATSMKKAMWTDDVQDRFSQRISVEISRPLWIGAGAASAFFFGPAGAAVAGLTWAASSALQINRARPSR